MRTLRSLAPLLLVALCGCYKVSTEVSEYSPYTGRDPLTIRGVWPGQDGAEVIALLGPPEHRASSGYGAETLQWRRFSNVAVTLETAKGRVTEVLGDEVTAGKDTIVSKGMSEADVRQVLGKPAKEQTHYRPSGSGVISLGRKQAGRTLWYRRDGRTFEISVQENGVAYVRLRLPPP